MKTFHTRKMLSFCVLRSVVKSVTLDRPLSSQLNFFQCSDGGCRCVDDLLYIYGGPSLDSPLIGAYCGFGTLTDLKTQTNGAAVR